MCRLVLCIALLFALAESAKILGVFMTPSISHQVVFQPIWRELSRRGHQLTVFTTNPLNDPTLVNLTEIDLSFSYAAWGDTMDMTGFSQSKLADAQRILDGYLNIFEAQISSPEMQKLIKNENNEQYDLFLVEYLYPGMYALKEILNCPMVGITSLPLTITGTEALGLLKHPVLEPDYMLMPVGIDLSFMDRVRSTFLYILSKIKLTVVPIKATDIARKYIREDVREVYSIARDVSLVLGNYNMAIQNAKPMVPAFVGISGMHILPEKPLPKSLKRFLDEAMEGVVYFSLGTNIKSRHFPNHLLEEVVAALGEIPYKVLWKFEGDHIKNLSSNVEIRKWFPQQDVLRHPNVKLFITQGGIQSVDEALYNKVPLLFIPVFGDQHMNAQKMVTSGAGLSMNYLDITKESLKKNIHTIIKNPKFKQAVTKLGEIAFDEMVSPLDKAIWWIEYVLRHNGAPHLKYKGADLPSYQFYLLDGFLFIAVISGFTLFVILKLFKIVALTYRFCRRTIESASISNLYVKKSQ